MNIQRCKQRRQRRGFTLMELLLVMAILVIMASMVGFAFLNMQRNAQEDAARANISTLKTACKQYKMDVGRFPGSLNDLATQPSAIAQNKWRGPYIDIDNLPPSGEILDVWDNQYSYNVNERTNTVTIRSPGQDGQPNTEDDIPRADEMNNAN